MQYENTEETKKPQQNRAKRYLMRLGICDKEDVTNVSKEVHSTCTQ